MLAVTDGCSYEKEHKMAAINARATYSWATVAQFLEEMRGSYLAIPQFDLTTT
jgi:hypothetical protein